MKKDKIFTITKNSNHYYLYTFSRAHFFTPNSTTDLVSKARERSDNLIIEVTCQVQVSSAAHATAPRRRRYSPISPGPTTGPRTSLGGTLTVMIPGAAEGKRKRKREREKKKR